MSESLFQPTSVKPIAERVDTLLTFDSAVSHHDPAVQDDSNVLLFNRQKQLVKVESTGGEISAATIEKFCAAHPVPKDLVELLGELSFEEFVACALVRHFADVYNSASGTGLFEGMERWPRLEARAKQAAMQAITLRGFWDILSRRMNVSIPAGSHDDTLLSFFTVPKQAASAVLRALSLGSNSITALGRVWHDGNKTDRKLQEDGKVLSFNGSISNTSGQVILEVPSVSSNSIRHITLRAPGWLHLAGALGLRGGEPGEGELALGAEAMFVNGGNIASGAKAPGDPFNITVRLRKAFPLLDLIGGVTDTFDIGASKVKVNSWIVCSENRDALRGTIAYESDMADVSVFDMLDDVTHTRMEVNGRGQMIYNFETLCAGVQILNRYTLAPYTPELTRGAFAAALNTFNVTNPTTGGQSARGFGSCHMELLSDTEQLNKAQQVYEDYLSANIDKLREGLIEGDMCTGHLLVS